MSAGETLLKISDFPFSYSLIAIILGTLNLDIRNENLVIFISAAGALGTFLTITDPLGRLLKLWMKRDIDRVIRASSDSILAEKLHSAKQAMETRAISIEIDKFVSLGYFVIILLAYNTLFVYSLTFSETLILKDKTGKIICDIACIRNDGNLVSFLAALIVIIVGVRNWKKLKKYVITAGIHQTGISSEDVTRSTIENITKAIDQNDWTTAEKWSVVVEKEIQTKKGRKETLMKLVDTVYQPLYQEMSTIEMAYNNSKGTRNSIPYITTAWEKIRQDPIYLMLTEENFRTEIESFYTMFSEYNSLENSARAIAEEIVRNRILEVYGPDVGEVYYFVRTAQGQVSAPALWECLLLSTHPKNRFDTSSVPQFIQVQSRSSGRSENRTNEDDFNQFETFWGIAVNDVNKNRDLEKRRTLYDKIIAKNTTLKTKVFENIQQAFSSS